MALTITLEDGTGVEGANAFDSVADCEAWLVDRGFGSFAAADADGKIRALVLATELVMNWLEPRLEGYKVEEDQGLLFPRGHCRGRDWTYFETDELPTCLREGIFLMAEEWAEALANGRRISTATASNIAAESSDGQSIQYRAGGPDFWSGYPEAFDKVSGVLTPVPIARRGF